MVSADPLPYKAGEHQGDLAAAYKAYKAACLHADKVKEHSLEPSESTASGSSVQQAFRQPLDIAGYKADPRPVSEQRSE